MKLKITNHGNISHNMESTQLAPGKTETLNLHEILDRSFFEETHNLIYHSSIALTAENIEGTASNDSESIQTAPRDYPKLKFPIFPFFTKFTRFDAD